MAFYILSRWKVKTRGLLALQSCWKKPTGLHGISYSTDSRECPTLTPVIRAAERWWGREKLVINSLQAFIGSLIYEAL